MTTAQNTESQNNHHGSSISKQVLLVSGLAGAGKSTALRTLEDIGWEAVDNFPIRLIGSLLQTPPAHNLSRFDPPIAIGFDSRTRGFAPGDMVSLIQKLQDNNALRISTLFLDCQGKELERRFTETRRRHPLALDRPVTEGISLERTMLAPLRRWADKIVNTTDMSASDFQQHIRQEYALDNAPGMTISLNSFGFSRGIPNNVDLLFDMRLLRNPFWDTELKALTGRQKEVQKYIASDPHFDTIYQSIFDLLDKSLPLYKKVGKAYVNIGVGCTGGRHRSVFVTEKLGEDLVQRGFDLNIIHRDLQSRPIEAIENMQPFVANNISGNTPNDI